MSRGSAGMTAGLVLGAIGAWAGYEFANSLTDGELPPITSAITLGAIGFFGGALSGFLLQTFIKVVTGIVVLFAVAYFLRDTIEAYTGVDPVDGIEAALQRAGVDVPDL